jgi:protein-tyrosine phosphatase
MSLRLATAPNLRDVGGAATRDGRVMRKGLVYRSEAILDPDAADVELLDAASIRLVCDLRGASERKRAPNLWWQRRGVRLIELDILADIRGPADVWDTLRADPTIAGARAIMATIYRELPAAAALHLGVITRHIAAGDLPILIHCTAGKDRTGFLIAALLRMAGATDDAIMADYLASGERLNAVVARATHDLVTDHLGHTIDESALAALTGVDRAYLEISFAEIDTRYGSFDDYIRDAAQIDTATLDAARARLLQSPDA